MHQELYQQKRSYPTTPYFLRMMLGSNRPLVDPLDNHRYVISLNPSLAGKTYPYPDMKLDTVAFFIGKPGNVWFDEHGYTYISLVDGSAIKATRAEVPKLRWLL
jgi:hypothetical protein